MTPSHSIDTARIEPPMLHSPGILLAIGSPRMTISDAELGRLVVSALAELENTRKIALIPPDYTRFPSKAGFITSELVQAFGERVTDIIPALGTHEGMPQKKIEEMFPGCEQSLFREHHYATAVSEVGVLSADTMRNITGGLYEQPLPVNLNSILAAGDHDAIVSIGQILPHEVAGIANEWKNLFIGVGGKAFIDASHWIGALAGIERVMGTSDNPVRAVFKAAARECLSQKNVIFVFTVRGPAGDEEVADQFGLVTRGVFVGRGDELFEQAARLAMQVNFIKVPEELTKVVTYLDPSEFNSFWLGNKAIYRTRLALADSAELVVMGPAVYRFGEKDEIDTLIRRHGYWSTEHVKQRVRTDPQLSESLSAAAHLIHGSPEGRFKVTWCPGLVPELDVTKAGYSYGDCSEMLRRYDPTKLKFGKNVVDGEEIFFVPNPAQVLLAAEPRLARTSSAC